MAKSIITVVAEMSAAGATADTIKALLDHDKSEKDRKSKLAFIEAKIAVKNELQPIIKTDVGEKGNLFASYEKASEIADPIIQKHGFSISFAHDPKGSQLHTPEHPYVRIEAVLMHKEGYVMKHWYDLPVDNVGAKGNVNKTRVQGSGSSTSYGKRYLKMGIFDIIVVDEDYDGAMTVDDLKPIDQEDWDKLASIVTKNKRDLVKFTVYQIERYGEHTSIAGIPNIPKSKLDHEIKEFMTLITQAKLKKIKQEAAQ